MVGRVRLPGLCNWLSRCYMSLRMSAFSPLEWLLLSFLGLFFFFFFSSRRRHTRFKCDWSSDVCSSDLYGAGQRADHLGRHFVLLAGPRCFRHASKTK